MPGVGGYAVRHSRWSPPDGRGALKRTAREVKAHDGRVLAVDVSGAAHGVPVFLFHGTPGSRQGPKPRGSVLYRLGIRLISYDRPGYGGSTRRGFRTVADAAGDVEAIADEFGITRFSVVGRSGGGPHALACAALLPARVARTGVLVSLARADAVGLDWFEGMAGSNSAAFSEAEADRLAFIERIRLDAERTRQDPESLLASLSEEATDPDKRFVNDVAMRRLLSQTYAEAVKHGPAGWIDDVFALRGDWGFNLEAISGPVRLWHGEDDNFAPVSHTRWLASKIPHAEVLVQPGAAHFGAVEVLPEMLSWLARGPKMDEGR